MFRSVEKEQLKVPAHIDYLGDLRDFVTQIGKKNGFADKVVNAFKLAVDEAATNIIRHAYRDKQGLITIRAFVKKESLTISLIDQGTFFDPTRVKDPDLNRYVHIGKKGGLGIFIMRKLMDEIDYRKTEEGNELRITKNREGAQKKKILGAVSAIPFSLKVKYFTRTVAVLTVFIAAGYFYFFSKTDDKITSEFISSVTSTNRRITDRINSTPVNEYTLIEDLVQPIYLENQSLVHKISMDDSTGVIIYSSDANELFANFLRPDDFAKVDDGIYNYKLNDLKIYELESPVVLEDFGKGNVHVFFVSEDMENEIKTTRLNNLKLALVILAASFAGVALLIYLLLNPLRKLSDWVRTLGQGEIEDEMDIDSSTEIGEIARAFSDITHKFRDSQKNLVDQERLQKEMQVAKEIQQTLLPLEFPKLEGYELAAYYEAAKEVGGDYYDFVEVDKDTIGIAVADVSGKGVPGSLVMTMIRTALRTEARGVKDAAEVLSRVNSFVINDIKKGMFVTVFYLIIDSKKRRLNYASAGHNPMILYRASTKQTYYLNPNGFPIGVQLPEKDYFRNYIESDTIQLTKDDILLLYTDGITEAMNSRRELFGEERLHKVLMEQGHLSAELFVEEIKNAIYSFTEGSPQYDDVTLVAIKEESTREEDELRRAKQVHKLIAEGKSIREACEVANLTTYAYYNKYKKIFEKKGIEAFEIDEEVSVEAKHLSIEEKTKIFDIVSEHPEYGASRIKDELNTEKYQHTAISERRIYEELVRSRLNTRQLREAFISRSKKSKKRMKSPGTPFMSLDGNVVMKPEEQRAARQTDFLGSERKVSGARDPDTKKIDFEAASLLDTPIDELLSKNEDTSVEESSFESLVSDLDDSEFDIVSDSDVSETLPSEMNEQEQIEEPENLAESSSFDLTEPDEKEEEDTSLLADFSFEDLFDSGMMTTDDDDFEAETDGEKSGESVVDSVDVKQQDSKAFESHYIPEPESKRLKTAPKQTLKEDLKKDELDPVDEGITETAEKTSEKNKKEFDFVPDVPESKTEEIIDETDGTSDANNDDAVSFSDLIQALDDEIVYVKEPANVKPKIKKEHRKERASKSSSQSIMKSKEVTSTKVEPPPSLKSNAESKERKLITGIKYYKNNEFDDAIKEFKKVIGIYPDYKEAHSILGNAFFRNKMYNEAASAYNKVKKLDPNDVTAYENLGVIHANRSEFKQAVSQWKKVLELSPERTDIRDKIKKALHMISLKE